MWTRTSSKIRFTAHVLKCVDCHKDVKSLAHETPPQKVSCAAVPCERAGGIRAQQPLEASREREHSGGDVRGLPRRAHGMTCRRHPKSPVNHANIPATCGRCHGQKFLMESNGQSAQPFISYQESVHGRAVEKVRRRPRYARIATGRTGFSRPTMRKSPIYKFNVPATCGKCHTDIQTRSCRAFTGRRSRAAMGRPRCARTATGFTRSRRTADPNSPASEQNLSRDTCARCHEGVRLIAGVWRARQPRFELS
jgi:hypothetical protein